MSTGQEEQRRRHKRYTDLMGEVKLRLLYIEKLAGQFSSVGGRTFGDNVFIYESMCLQLRKVLELIAFSTLVANQKTIEPSLKGYEEFWKAKVILKKVAALNPHFFPMPVRVFERPDGRTQLEVEPREDAFALAEFPELYDACSQVVHTNNPYSAQTLTPIGRPFTAWVQRMRNLLQTHLVYLTRDDLQFVDMLDWSNGTVQIAHMEVLGRNEAAIAMGVKEPQVSGSGNA